MMAEKYMSDALETRARQQEIASLSKVSRSTVSRCLRGKSDVDLATRAKVLKIASELGYRPPATRAMSESCITLGVFIANKPHHGDLSRTYLQGASLAAEKLNALVTVSYTSPCEQAVPSDVILSSPALEPGRLNGSILIHHDIAEPVARRLASLAPCVAIAHEYPGLGISHVEADNLGGIRTLMERLHALGHTRIGFAGSFPCDFLWYRRRLAAYLESRLFLALPEDPRYCIRATTRTQAGYDELVSQRIIPLIEEGVRAWMCVNDPMAVDVCRRLVAAGYRIPQDVSITGFDGLKSVLPQPLTTIRLPAKAMGAAAVQLLVQQIRNTEWAAQTMVVGVECIEGETIGPCPV
jgi:DNA-binding LacI/PurR family transcriptional regulator